MRRAADFIPFSPGTWKWGYYTSTGSHVASTGLRLEFGPHGSSAVVAAWRRLAAVDVRPLPVQLKVLDPVQFGGTRRALVAFAGRDGVDPFVAAAAL